MFTYYHRYTTTTYGTFTTTTTTSAIVNPITTTTSATYTTTTTSSTTYTTTTTTTTTSAIINPITTTSSATYTTNNRHTGSPSLVPKHSPACPRGREVDLLAGTCVEITPMLEAVYRVWEIQPVSHYKPRPFSLYTTPFSHFKLRHF